MVYNLCTELIKLGKKYIYIKTKTIKHIKYIMYKLQLN